MHVTNLIFFYQIYAQQCKFNLNGYWVGLHLESPLGAHNGTVKDIQYFKCPENHGLFVRFIDIIRRLLTPQELDALVVLQRIYRGYIGKKTAHAKQAARMWNILDNYNEEMNLRRGKQLSQATRLLRSEVNVESSDNIQLQDTHDSSSEDELFNLVQGTTVEELQDAAGNTSSTTHVIT